VRCLAEHARFEPRLSRVVDETFIKTLESCALLHDIGNVALPDHILCRMEALDPEDQIVLESHTTIGADTLKSVARWDTGAAAFWQMAIDIARHHHERFDGEGYPDRLAGSNIPLSARLVTVCDVYDALRSRRSYKPALSHSTAMQVMTKVSAGQFDPDLMQVFLRCAHHFERIFRKVTE
jgi:response regulator RpfG family c-di-GMP phosphodiesterase